MVVRYDNTKKGLTVSIFFLFSKLSRCEIDNSTSGVENHFKMVSKKKSQVVPKDIVCDSNPSLTLDHRHDPDLTIMLTLVSFIISIICPTLTLVHKHDLGLYAHFGKFHN